MDKWADWLLKKRFGGNEETFRKTMEMLGGVRDKIFEAADVQPGETVLDVGTGDGLLAMKALELVGTEGKVIFSDISESCLDHCRQFATGPNTQFLLASAEDLHDIPPESIDVVVLRSVLIYVEQKERALSEFIRVLKHGGRLSLFEPINRFSQPPGEKPKGRLFGMDMTPLEPLAEKVKNVASKYRDNGAGPMMNFDERDLLSMAEGVGYAKIGLHYEATIDTTYRQPPFDLILHQSPNPNVPTLSEILDEALTPVERAEFEAYVRPRLPEVSVTRRQAAAYLYAVK
jgi:arsenite methyltransferase